MDPVTVILIVVIVLMSVVIHEVAHGYAALWLGDTTALYAGRLTLNPLKHLDWFGSIILPLLLSFSGVMFGWAKPVPYNPYNLNNRRWGELLVAIAGPLSNIALALIFGLFLRFGGIDMVGGSSALVMVSMLIVQINLVLAIFNLVPIPPLDGSKVLFALLPAQQQNVRIFLERWGMMLVLLFIFFFWQLLTPIIGFLFSLITGIAF